MCTAEMMRGRCAAHQTRTPSVYMPKHLESIRVVSVCETLAAEPFPPKKLHALVQLIPPSYRVFLISRAARARPYKAGSPASPNHVLLRGGTVRSCNQCQGEMGIAGRGLVRKSLTFGDSIFWQASRLKPTAICQYCPPF